MTEELGELPERPDAAALGAMDGKAIEAARAELQRLERETIAMMRPYEMRLREIRNRMGEVATETRRRERQSQIAQRAQVRAAAKSGAAPTIAQLLAAPGDIPPDQLLSDLPTFLVTGGEVGLGFATKPGTLTFTDGRQAKSVVTWHEAQDLYSAGWDLGSAGMPGIRIHLKGTRTERVVGVDDVIVRL